MQCSESSSFKTLIDSRGFFEIAKKTGAGKAHRTQKKHLFCKQLSNGILEQAMTVNFLSLSQCP